MLPVVSGKQARKAFEKAGWSFIRQRGSHMILTKAGVDGNLSVPDHANAVVVLRMLLALGRATGENVGAVGAFHREAQRSTKNPPWAQVPYPRHDSPACCVIASTVGRTWRNLVKCLLR